MLSASMFFYLTFSYISFLMSLAKSKYSISKVNDFITLANDLPWKAKYYLKAMESG